MNFIIRSDTISTICESFPEVGRAEKLEDILYQRPWQSVYRVDRLRIEALQSLSLFVQWQIQADWPLTLLLF